MNAAIEEQDFSTDDRREIVVFSKHKPQSRTIATSGYTGHWVNDFQTLQHTGSKPCVFIIKSDNPNYVQYVVRKLRRDPEHYAALIYIDGDINETDLQITDGRLPDPSTLVERVEEFYERQSMIVELGDTLEPDTRLLKYMWLRPGYILEPQRDWMYKRHYRYPILEALDRTESDSEIWINKLHEERLIEKFGLRDRQKECDYCDSAHLEFIDVCTNCRSLDIDRHHTLHCFTCGMVGPEQNFLKQDMRACPKCNTRLRHIGTDYDRPVETHICNQCAHVFVEGEVIARCSICEKYMETTQLKQKKINAWRLSGLGRLAAQRGSADSRQALFDPMNYAKTEHFISSLDWMLKITREDGNQSFSLIGLHMDNRDAVGQSLGFKTTSRLLDAFADRLHEVLNDSDLGMRPEPETIYLLLPNASKKRINNLKEDIKHLSELTKQNNGIDPEWSVTEISVINKNAKNLSAETLLGRLRSTLSIDPEIGLA